MNTKIIGWLSVSFIAFILVWILISSLFLGHPGRAETVEQYVEFHYANMINYAINFLFHLVLSVWLTFIFLSIYQETPS